MSTTQDFKPGDTVQLMSGGPIMTVEKLITPTKDSTRASGAFPEVADDSASGNNHTHAVCCWFTNRKGAHEMESKAIPIVMLQKVKKRQGGIRQIPIRL